MPSAVRTLLAGAALVVALPLLYPSASAISSDAAEIQLQMGNILFSDGRYIEAFDTFEQIKTSEDPHVRRRALTGSVRSSLRLADFVHAHRDAEALMKMGPQDAEAIALHGDSLWAMGLFEEAEQRFKDALAIQPSLPRAMHGLAKSLA